jgi:hypothetical protein
MATKRGARLLGIIGLGIYMSLIVYMLFLVAA